MNKKMNPIKRARLLAGLNQAELAKLLGVTPGAVSQWETGRSMPRPRMLTELSEVLRTPVDTFLRVG